MKSKILSPDRNILTLGANSFLQTYLQKRYYCLQSYKPQSHCLGVYYSFIGICTFLSLSNNTLIVQNKELDDKHAKFISTVLADTERIWQEIFTKSYGQNYTPPQLVFIQRKHKEVNGLKEGLR